MRKEPLPNLSYGEGSMFYNNDGDIVYKKMVYRSDGQRVRKSVKGSSVVECINRMKEKEQDLLKEPVNLLNKTDFKEEIYYWLDNVKKNTLKKQSWERLESTVRNNILDTPIGKKKVQEITSKDIQQMINNMNDGHYTHSSIKKVYDALNDFFRYISKRDQFYNPMGSVVCVSKYNTIKEAKEVDYLDQNDMKKFIAQAMAVWESSGNPRYRYGNVIVANLYMGLRIGELLALRWRDVCFDKDYVVVNKTLIEEKNPLYDDSNPEKMKSLNIKKVIFRVQRSTKTGKARKVPLNNASKKYLLYHLNQTEYDKTGDFVVATRNGKSTTPKNIQDAIASILKNADTKMQSSNTHIMRHTCASLLFRNGIDLNTIARILGNSEEVLRKTYVHFDDDNLKRIIEMIEDIE
ncbi:MAG: site-specific integrase [Oscillospiraceae bacterium]|nr:site-specific integrase [Oscillospiraceae bacterium]